MFSEEEVRTKVAIPLLEELGYAALYRAEDYPVHVYEGRTEKSKKADILVFANSEFNAHRTKDEVDIKWVYDHSLLTIELKNPSEDIVGNLDNGLGQSISYVFWTRALYYMVLNGREIGVYRLCNGCADECILSCNLCDLLKHWTSLMTRISFSVLCREKQAALEDASKAVSVYYNYCLSKISFIEQSVFKSHVEQHFSHSPNEDKNGKIAADEILSGDNAIIFAPSGYGKTHFLKESASKLATAHLSSPIKPIPVVLQCGLWKRNFNSIEEGILNELSLFVPGLTPQTVQNDLSQNRYFLLFDALDECKKDADLLIGSIAGIARRTNTKILVTTKSGSIPTLLISFKGYYLCCLNETQVNTLTEISLGYNPWLLRTNLSKMMGTLLQTPLFLYMYLSSVVKENLKWRTEFRRNKPHNLASVYSSYINRLLDEYLVEKGIAEKGCLSIESLKSILTRFAQQALDYPENIPNIDSAILFVVSNADLLSVRKVLHGSNIMVEEEGITRFQFDSVREYFYSLYLLQQSETNILSYIDRSNEDDSSPSIILFMIGGMMNEKAQNAILDYLERTNLVLYVKCLKMRYNFSEQYSESLTQDMCIKLLNQIRISYLNIVNSHFVVLKRYLLPWGCYHYGQGYGMEDFQACLLGDIDPQSLDVHIKWTLDTTEASSVRLGAISEKHWLVSRDADAEEKSLPNLSLVKEKSWFINLDVVFGGIDCAREIALMIVFDELEDILKGKRLLECEHPFMKAEYLESCLDILPNQSNHKKVSLRDFSLDEIEGIANALTERFKDVLEDNAIVHYHSSRRSEGIPMSRVTGLIAQLKAYPFDIQPLLPPKGDCDWSLVKRWTWERFTLSAMMKRIAWFYDAYQECYRQFVETALPTLKSDMPLYNCGPVQYLITMYADEKEHEKCKEDYLVKIIWVPVQDMQECKTAVLVEPLEENKGWAGWDNYFDDVLRKAKFFGRKSDGFGWRNCGITYFMDESIRGHSLRNEVFESLFKEIEKILK